MSGVERMQTPRLLLTRLRPDDFDDLYALHTNAETMATLGGVRGPDETRRVLDLLCASWAADGFGYWLARDRASGRFVGRGGLRRVLLDGQPEVEIGYALLPEYWGRGLATELARASIRIAFEELGLPDVVAFTLPTNRASQRVMERAGLRHVGNTVWADLPHVLYRLTASAWRESP